MEWLALLIPFAVAIVLLIFFRHKTVWWEFLIPFGVSLLLIFLLKFTAESAQTMDTEYWGGWVSKAEYYEPWNERVSCRHPKYKTVRDKDGHTHQVQDGYLHAYDVDYHGPYWQVIDSNGETISIDKNQFPQLCNKFGNKQWVDMHRHYHTIDGDKFETNWNRSDETLEPVVTSHTYENRVQASSSVFNFPKVKKEQIKEFQLFDYPKIRDNYKCDSILGHGDPNQSEANKLLNFYNAKLGASKQVRMIILIFRGQPLDAGFLQEGYWKRGNKNEFVVTIGIDSENTIQWSYVFSWTESEELITKTRNFILDQKKLDLVNIVKWMAPNVESDWVRRHFSTFNYLKVEIPGWAMIMIFVITALVNVGLSVWIIKNPFEDKE
jgi:hypothetical protein